MFIRARKLGYLCLLILSAAIVLIDLHQRILLGQKLTPEEGAKIVPQEAIAAAYVSNDPQQWKLIETFVAPAVKNELAETYSAWLNKTVIVSKNNYTKSVQPWLGNIVLALIPEQNSQTNSKNFLIVAGIENKVKAYTFGKTVENASRLQKNFKTYKHAPVVEVSDRQSTVFLSLVDNKLLVSDSSKVIERAIEVSKNSRSFLKRKDAESLFSQQGRSNLMLQLYVPDIAQLHDIIFKPVPEHLIKEIQASDVESVLVEVQLNKKEVQLDAIAKLNTEVTEQKCQAVRQEISGLIEAKLSSDLASQLGSFASRANAAITERDRCSLQKTLKKERFAQLSFLPSP